MTRRWRIAGINFDHMHMGDNLRMAHVHPQCEIVGLCDERSERMQAAIANFAVPRERVFTDWRACLETTKPDLVVLCPATAEHARWVERVARFGVNILMEKPFAASLAEADRMVAAMKPGGKLLAINWPLAWYPPHVTAKRLLDEGRIGRVVSLNYYDGNRGPLYHLADKRETSAAFRTEEKAKSWFYKRERGGGSLLDYLGYGTTLGTWLVEAQPDNAPLEVTTVVDQPAGLEVDEHSITLARFAFGLARFETRWGTFTDPWTHQPQPKCGFEIDGTDGTISSYDYEPTIRVQTRTHPEGEVIPVDRLAPPRQNPIQYVLHCLETGEPLRGPLSPTIARAGQVLVDAAVASAKLRRTIDLADGGA